MASRLFNQFVNSLVFEPVYVEGSFVIGPQGKPLQNGAFVGSGIPGSSTLVVQQKGTGIYFLQLTDPYNRFLGASFTVLPPANAQVLPDGSSAIIVGKAYQVAASTTVAPNASSAAFTPFQAIGAIGSTGTNWYTLGLPSDQTPYVGSPFVATSAASNIPGSSTQAVGTGWLQPIGVSNIVAVQVLPDVNLQLFPSSTQIFDNGPGQTQALNNANIWFQTIVGTSGAPTLATSGTTIRYNLMLRGSSRTGYNEASTANLN